MGKAPRRITPMRRFQLGDRPQIEDQRNAVAAPPEESCGCPLARESSGGTPGPWTSPRRWEVVLVSMPAGTAEYPELPGSETAAAVRS
jgi:hypothetical protein